MDTAEFYEQFKTLTKMPDRAPWRSYMGGWYKCGARH
jgi:hypothetical protein